MLLAISVVFISDYEHVFACKETSYVKDSNLYNCWKSTLQISFFLFEES